MTKDIFYLPAPRRHRFLRFFGWLFATTTTIIIIVAVASWIGLNRPADSSATATQVFTVAPGSSEVGIANRLYEAHLIKHPLALVAYAKLWVRGTLKAGDYRLSPSQTPRQILAVIESGDVIKTVLVVPEGYSVRQIEAELPAKTGLSVADFTTAMNQVNTSDYSFLASKPSTVDLEGYLFPDSYTLSDKPDARALVKGMLDNFGIKITPLLPQVKATGLDLHGVITLASIVEKEASKTSDRKLIAGILYRRLAAGMLLQSDVTAAYPGDAADLTQTQITADTPFNTYVHKGLPIGPICNPGLDSIQAALNPTSSDYSYFLADKTGVVHYAKTLEEHNAQVSQYLGR